MNQNLDWIGSWCGTHSAQNQKKEKTTLLSVIEEKLMVHLGTLPSKSNQMVALAATVCQPFRHHSAFIVNCQTPLGSALFVLCCNESKSQRASCRSTVSLQTLHSVVCKTAVQLCLTPRAASALNLCIFLVCTAVRVWSPGCGWS